VALQGLAGRLYSYHFRNEHFSGEWRKSGYSAPYGLSDPSTVEIKTEFPRGTAISVRVDPDHPESSFAEL
jgi:hypothetical protein